MKRNYNVEYLSRPELARFMAERKGYSIKGASEAIVDVFECLEELFIDHKSVNIQGFGKFTIAQIKPRKVWDFKNNKAMLPTKPMWRTLFTPSDILKREIKEGQKEV